MTGPYTGPQLSSVIGAGDTGTGRFDSLYAEAKSALGHAANTLRDLTERYREAYHADLAAWHAEHDELDGAEFDAPAASAGNGPWPGTGTGDPAHSGELRRMVALGASELGERGTELSRLELAVRGLERTWLFMERGDASLQALAGPVMLGPVDGDLTIKDLGAVTLGKVSGDASLRNATTLRC